MLKWIRQNRNRHVANVGSWTYCIDKEDSHYFVSGSYEGVNKKCFLYIDKRYAASFNRANELAEDDYEERMKGKDDMTPHEKFMVINKKLDEGIEDLRMAVEELNKRTSAYGWAVAAEKTCKWKIDAMTHECKIKLCFSTECDHEYSIVVNPADDSMQVLKPLDVDHKYCQFCSNKIDGFWSK